MEFKVKRTYKDMYYFTEPLRKLEPHGNISIVSTHMHVAKKYNSICWQHVAALQKLEYSEIYTVCFLLPYVAVVYKTR